MVFDMYTYTLQALLIVYMACKYAGMASNRRDSTISISAWIWEEVDIYS